MEGEGLGEMGGGLRRAGLGERVWVEKRRMVKGERWEGTLMEE